LGEAVFFPDLLQGRAQSRILFFFHKKIIHLSVYFLQ
jgi:hypothetical protein